MNGNIDLIVYTLDGHTPVPTTDLLEWARWFHEADRRVAETETFLYRVSTVFLGVDYGFGFGNGPPVVFETMVFDKPGGPKGELDGWIERYSTWDEAEKGHEATVRRVTIHEAAKAVAERAKREEP